MNKKVVFEVELINGNYYAGLNLPATDYELLDALDRLRMQPQDTPEWELTYYEGFSELAGIIERAGDIYEINALAKVMAEHDYMQEASFEALIKNEIDKQYGVIPLSTIYDLATSVDGCHTVNLRTDEQLGRFYVENDFLPELNDVPDKVLEMLDYAKIGRQMRQEEGGVFAGGYYITQTDELKKSFDDLDLSLQKPDYSVLLEISIMNEPKKTMCIKLPVSKQELSEIKESLKTENECDIVCRCADCRIPELADTITQLEEISLINQAAIQIAEISDDYLQQYKAWIDAVGADVTFPLPSPEEVVESHYFFREITEPSDFAKSELGFYLEPETLELLLPHVNLHTYGEALMENQGAKLTPYGLIERTDFQPFQTEDQTQGGMQMR